MLTGVQLLNVYLNAYTKKEASFYKPLQNVLGFYKKNKVAYNIIKNNPNIIYDLHAAGRINNKQLEFLLGVEHVFKTMAQKSRSKTFKVFRHGDKVYPVDTRTVFKSAITGRPLYTTDFPPTRQSIKVKERRLV